MFKKSSLSKVRINAFRAVLITLNLLPPLSDIELDVYAIKITFFLVYAFCAYHGLNLGS
jgi:hypothetical protein